MKTETHRPSRSHLKRGTCQGTSRALACPWVLSKALGWLWQHGNNPRDLIDGSKHWYEVWEGPWSPVFWICEAHFCPNFSSGESTSEDKVWTGRLLPALASESLSCWNSTISLKDTLESECLFPNDGLLLAVVFSRWKVMQTCTIVGEKHIVPAVNGLDSSTYQLPDLGQITDLSTS